ncbi:hypothetical protein [Spiroplasma endosymbiont of Polydrusus formosus]|uniref:hypothetical protein n=1 Tax=Spiroplasma endosymbiont of Polydrusus formosus TaxID=3139326 RepID=UPI0035B51261
MYQKITIEKLISIQQYQNFNYSIRKTVYEINQSKITVHKIYKMLIIGLNPIEIYENSNKDKKILLQTKTLNKIYLEIINYLVNYEQYSLDIITNIIRNIDKNFICSNTLYIICLTFLVIILIKKIYYEKVNINHIIK